MKYTTNLFFLVLFTMLFFACEKNDIEDLTLTDTELTDDSFILPSTTGITGNECQQKILSIQNEFESLYYTSSLNEEVFIANFGVPNWPKNDSYCDYFNPDSLIILPLVSLLGDNEIQSLLVIDKITRPSEYSFTVIGKYQFSEVLDNIHPDSIPESVTQLFEFFNYFTDEMSAANSSVNNVATIRCDPDKGGCGKSDWALFWSSFRRFFNRITSGGGGGGGGGNTGAYISPGTITFWNNTPPSTGGNNIPGGGSSSGNEAPLCTNEKDALTFEELELVLNNLTQYYEEFGVSSTGGTPLIEMLQPGCAGLEDYAEFRSCLNASIVCSINENYDLSDDEESCVRNSPQVSLDVNTFLMGNNPNKDYIVNLYLRLICEYKIDISLDFILDVLEGTEQNFEDQEEFDEIVGEIVLKALLEERFDVEIVNVLIINGYVMGVDEDGILHINLEKLDINNISAQEKFDHIAEVIHCTRLDFCEEDQYKPIDWRDYFSGITDRTDFEIPDLDDPSASIEYEGCNVGINFGFVWGGFLMNTSPAFRDIVYNNGIGSEILRWDSYNLGTNRPILTISIPVSCSEGLLNQIDFDCD